MLSGTVEGLAVATTVRRPPEAVYDFLLDLSRYDAYSDHLETVTRHGDGGPGTEYDLRFSWWGVGYTVRSRVTTADRSETIGFELVSGIDAAGEWRIEPAEDGSHVEFAVRYAPGSVAGDAVSLPALVSLDWVVERARPFVEAEARRVIERAVADLEGEHREVDLDVRVE